MNRHGHPRNVLERDRGGGEGERGRERERRGRGMTDVIVQEEELQDDW